jgi:organic hydroperoxide reductase OsmC/OhrA
VPALTATRHGARVVWDANRDDLRAHTVHVGELTVAASSAAELGGNGAKANPEDMLVASASACHMLWFIDFARRERLRVASYSDDAEGTMDGVRFTRVVLRPAVAFGSDPGPELVSELHARAHAACFIANSLNCPVEVEPR